ncbi:MAG: hypothetical protein ABW136_06355 [Steroidobacteraceae bacterium]
MNDVTFKTLVKREYWEHRGLWLAPAATAGVLIIAALFALVRSGEVHFGPRGFSGRVGGMESGDALTASVFPIAGLLMLVGSLTISLFLLDCLYAERKDRSILFWKSLPVSDTQTVLSKLAVAVVITPIGIGLLAIATHVVCLLLLRLFPPATMAFDLMWSPGAQLRAYGWIFALMAVNAVWFLPWAGYSLLASVLSRRSPMLIAILPLVLVPLAERLAFGTSYVARWLGSRARPTVDLSAALADPQWWVGAAIGAALIVTVIRLRRWRDDS